MTFNCTRNHAIISTKQLFTCVLQKSYSEKFRKIHEKAPVLERIFNNITGLFSCEFCENFQDSFLSVQL